MHKFVEAVERRVPRLVIPVKHLLLCLIKLQKRLLQSHGASIQQIEKLRRLRIVYAYELRRLKRSLKSEALRPLPYTLSSTSNGSLPLDKLRPKPPIIAERVLLLLLSKKDRDYVLGDLEEEFIKIAERHGERYARFWYFTQAAASIRPLLWSAVKWGLGDWIDELFTLTRELIRRFFS